MNSKRWFNWGKFLSMVCFLGGFVALKWTSTANPIKIPGRSDIGMQAINAAVLPDPAQAARASSKVPASGVKRPERMNAFFTALSALFVLLAAQAAAGPLHDAVNRGDLQAVRGLLQKGADLNAKDQLGRTPLLLAVTKHRPDMVKFLLDRGADVNKADDRGVSPLIEAASRGQTDTVEILLKHRADVNAKDGGARTALMAAEAGKYADVAELLRKAGARSLPLHEAVHRGDLKAMRSLLKNGADVNAKDFEGRTPLILAIFEDSGSPTADGVTPVEKLLMEYKADVNAKDNNGRTALMTASHKFDVDMVKFLIKQKADVNAKDNNGLTALMKAAFGDKAGVKIDLMELLLKHKADINAKDNNGENALMKAAFEGYVEAARVLIEHKADVDAKDNDGETALMKSLSRGTGHIETAKLLLDHGADPNAKDNNGRTALMFGVKGYEGPAELLVKHKADVNAKDNEGKTVLMWAADGGRPAIVQFLLEQKADLRAKDNKGRTARAIAEAKGLAYLVKIFQDAEASENLDVAVVPEALLKGELLQVKQREDDCTATFPPLPLTKYRQWHQGAYRAADGGERFNQTAWTELKRRPELLEELRSAKLAGLGRLKAYAKLLDQESPPARWARDRQWIVESEIADLARVKKELAGLDERALARMKSEQWRNTMSRLRMGFIENGGGVLSPDLNWMGAKRMTVDFCKKDVRDADADELFGYTPLKDSFEEVVVRELSLGEIVRLSKLVHEVKMKSDFVKSFNVLSAPRVEFDEKTKCATAVEVERKRFSPKINWGSTGEESAPFERKRVTRAEWHAFLRRLDLVR